MYIKPSDLIQAFSEAVLIKLSNDDYRATELNTQILSQAIQVAEERIDAALRSRYRLPLDEVPTLLHAHALNLARYWLYSRRPEMTMPATVEKTYQQAIKELEQIANGRLHLGIAGVNDGLAPHGDLLPDSGEYRIKSPKRLNTGGY